MSLGEHALGSDAVAADPAQPTKLFDPAVFDVHVFDAHRRGLFDRRLFDGTAAFDTMRDVQTVCGLATARIATIGGVPMNRIDAMVGALT